MIPYLGALFIMAGLQDLWKADECLADHENNQFSLNTDLQSKADKPTNFELYSDRMVRIFPTYVFDSRCRVRPGPETQRVNFDALKNLLLSNDLARNVELDWVSAKNLRFLDGADMLGE